MWQRESILCGSFCVQWAEPTFRMAATREHRIYAAREICTIKCVVRRLNELVVMYVCLW